MHVPVPGPSRRGQDADAFAEGPGAVSSREAEGVESQTISRRTAAARQEQSFSDR